MRHALISCLFFFVAASATAQAPIPADAEFQVNAYTTDYQAFAKVAVRSVNGDFVVVWQSFGSGSDFSGTSVQGQRFAGNGSPLGGQFQVNAYSTNNQYAPAVAVATNGDFVVVWSSYGSYGSDSDFTSVQGQRFAANGTALGGQFQVNTYTYQYQRFPAVAVDIDGDFVVVWDSYGAEGNSDPGVQGQRFASDGSPLGVEFQINSYTTDYQRRPDVAVAPNGDFVVVWHSYGSYGPDDTSSVQGQRFDSGGTALGGQFQVNTFTLLDQGSPAVGLDPEGDFVVVWHSQGSSGTDSSTRSIQGQRFAFDGTILGSEFQINTYTTGAQSRPAVAVDDGGDFVVAWETVGSGGSDTSGESIQGQRFAADGSPLGTELQLNSYTTSSQVRPSAATTGGGRLIVAWESAGSSGTDNDNFSAQARRFTVPNTPPMVTINSPLTGEVFDQGVAISFAGMAIDLEEGDLSAGLVWSSDRDGPIGTGATFMEDTLSVGAHRVGASSVDTGGARGSISVGVGVVATAVPTPIGGPITPDGTAGSQGAAGVATDAAGRFVTTWNSQDSAGDDNDGFSIQLQRYDAGGAPLGAELQVNTFTAGDQTAPAVGVTPAGAFVVAWQSASSAGSDTSGASIQARRYDASGAALGSDFQVNATTAGDQASPSVSVDSGGAFVIAWQSPTQDGSGLGIVAQRYDAGGSPLGGELQVNSYTTGDQMAPAISVDPAGDFLITWQSEGSAGDDNDGTSIQARGFSAAGAPVSADVQINATILGDQRRPALCRVGGGDVMIAWDSEHESSPRRGSIPIFGIRGRQMSFAATPAGDEAILSADSEDQQRAPALTSRRAGDFFAVWQHQVATASPGRGSIPIFNLRGASFSALFNFTVRLSPFFDLDSDLTDLQELPAVAAGEDGFVVFWQTDPAQTGDTDLIGQRFTNPVPPPPIEIFIDDFESGDTVRWSTAVP